MIPAVAQEWVRLRTVRSTWWLSGFAVFVSVLVTVGGLWAYGSARRAGFDGDQVEQEAYFFILTLWARPVSLLLALLAVLSFGHEYRYGTIRATLTTVPNRAAVGAAKVLVTAGWAAAVMVTALVLSWLLLTLFGGFSEAGLLQESGPRMALGVVLYGVLLSLLGLGIGWLVRNQLVAVVVLLVWALAAEGAITALFFVPALRSYLWLTNYLPLSAGRRMYGDTNGGLIDSVFGTPPSPLVGGLVMAATVAALLGVAYLLFEKRDA